MSNIKNLARTQNKNTFYDHRNYYYMNEKQETSVQITTYKYKNTIFPINKTNIHMINTLKMLYFFFTIK